MHKSFGSEFVPILVPVRGTAGTAGRRWCWDHPQVLQLTQFLLSSLQFMLVYISNYYVVVKAVKQLCAVIKAEKGKKKRLKCNFCNMVFSGITRIGLHLSGATGEKGVEVATRKLTSLRFDLQPGSLTVQAAGEHQPHRKHP